ncbi:MAG: magnesium transporter [Candidatus Krumholzibacteriia bacterium]|jgi:magnesium transporter
MKRYVRKRISIVRPGAQVAASPGTLAVHPNSIESRVTVIAYGPDKFLEEEVTDLSRLGTLSESHPVIWINVVGLGTLDVLKGLGEQFGLHRLALEDVLNIPQRPKIDDYGEHQFIVARMPIAEKHLETDQLSMFLGQNFLITFQEHPGDQFDPIRSRLKEGRPRIRQGGPDYLFYTVLDTIVDSYFPLLEHIRLSLDELEANIHDNPEKHHLHDLHSLKHDLVTLRRYVWPLRELNSHLLRPDNDFLSEGTRLYMRDCYDHSVHALDLVDSYRDIASGLMDLYLSLAGQRMNEVIKVLTIISTVFIPMSFLAGLYGMNFNTTVSQWNMPELGWSFGYPVLLGVMALCGTGMLTYFWRKGWFR